MAQYGDKLSANRPDPDDPGGLGAEESGIERTGPTQNFLVATQQGGRLTKIGQHYDSANDTVTKLFETRLVPDNDPRMIRLEALAAVR